MLGLAAATVFLSAPGQSFSVAAFLDPMLDELRLDRTTFSVAYMTATLISGLSLPLVGRLVDRLGARLVLPFVATGLGLACGWMSSIGSPLHLYIGFTMIRCLGQGALTLISSWIVGEWFHSWRGRAAGICAVGGTASVLIVPPLNDFLIHSFGWRNTWWMMGAGVIVLLVLPAIIFLRDRPEAIGLLPDCEYPADPAIMPQPEHPLSVEDHQTITPAVESWMGEDSFTVAQALKCSAFWKVAAVVGTVALVGTGLVFHQVSILAEHHVSRATALAAISVQACAATTSSLVAGYLTDRIPIRFVLAVSMLLEILAILLLLNLPSPNWAFVYSSLVGLHGGIIRSAGSVVWINYFGRRYQGSIQGVSMSLTILAAALGPVPLAWIYDKTGSYQTALVWFLVLPLLAGIGILSARPPAHPDRSSSSGRLDSRPLP